METEIAIDEGNCVATSLVLMLVLVLILAERQGAMQLKTVETVAETASGAVAADIWAATTKGDGCNSDDGFDAVSPPCALFCTFSTLAVLMPETNFLPSPFWSFLAWLPPSPMFCAPSPPASVESPALTGAFAFAVSNNNCGIVCGVTAARGSGVVVFVGVNVCGCRRGGGDREEPVDAGALESRGRVFTEDFVSAANPASVAASDW